MAHEAAVAHARESLEAGRAEVRARHRAGMGGQDVVRAISALSDAVIAELFHSLGGDGSGLSLVATGGYGRRELAPRSDIDLLALMPAKRNQRAEAVAESLHRALWDAGL